MNREEAKSLVEKSRKEAGYKYFKEYDNRDVFLAILINNILMKQREKE